MVAPLVPFISRSQSLGMSIRSGVGASSLHLIQSGPCLHSTLVDKSSGGSPLEGKSAGFSLPGQCLQEPASVSLAISVTRFCTKGFHCLPCPQIQYSVTWESLYYHGGSSSKWRKRAFLVVDMSLAKRSADSNSSLRIVWLRMVPP